jgi:hypothetical protein
MNEINEMNESDVEIRTGIQAGDDTGLLGSTGGSPSRGGGYMGSSN